LPNKGNYTLRVWATSPNDSFPDNVPSNDTLITNICTAMSGTYSIGASGSDYPNFNAAVTDLLKCGVYGPVTFNVSSGTYNERVIIPAIKGASSTNTITFKGVSKTGVTLQYSSISSTTDMQTVLLNGADYIRFEEMTIKANNTSYAVGVCLTNAADYNYFKNCNISVPLNTSTYCIPVMVSGSATSYSTAGNSGNYNTWEGCDLTGGYFGATFYGSGSSTCIIGNTFLKCNFYSHYYYGIYSYYHRELKVKNCVIDMTNPSFYTTSSYGIYSYYGQKHIIDGNIIKPGQYGIYTYYHNYYSQSDSSHLMNNIITGFTNTSYQIGLYAYYYNYNWRIYNNTIKVSGSTAGNYSYAALYLYYSYYAWIFNNILISTGNHLLLSFYPYPYGNATINYNDYIYPSTGTNNMFYSNSVYSLNLTAWKTNTSYINSPHDASSWENLDPHFVSGTDFHLDANYAPTYGMSLGLSSDVDGDARCLYATTIGADESKYPVPTPKSNFVSDDTVCHSTPITFYNSADPKAKQGYWWYFNGFFKTKNFNWSYTFPTGTGYDTVRLVTVNCGGSDTFEKYVYVDNPGKSPKADFISDLNVVEVMYPVQFSDISTNCPGGWTWRVKPATILHPQLGLVSTHTFVSPTIPSSQNPLISFDFPGTYEITLIAENIVGKDSIVKTKYITVKPLQWMCLFVPVETSKSPNGFLYDDGGPTSDYQNSKNCDLVLTPCAKELNLTFKDFNVASGDYLKLYEGTNSSGKPLWDLNYYGTNGLTGQITDAAFKKTVTSTTGKMYVQWITNSSGTAPGFNAEWNVVTGSWSSPQANFATPDTICVGTNVPFKNTSTALPEASYEWYFTSPYFAESFDKDPIYKFAFDGIFDVKLRVIDCGGESEITKTVVVISPFSAPKPDFEADNVRPVKGIDVVNFSGISQGCADTWTWSISPMNYTSVSGYPNTQFPSIKFNDTGCYTVKLVSEFKTMKDSIIKPCYIKVMDYCKPEVQVLTQDIGMTRVIVGSIDNSSTIGKYEYTDYTQSDRTYLDVEASYNITIERSSNFNPVDRKVWIDWNIDGDFDDAGEEVCHNQNSGAVSWTGSFKVPWNAMLGHTRMRVSTVMGGMTNNPCGSRLFGEVEDYKVIVRPDGTPPEIVLKGQDTVIMSRCTYNYTDSGATAIDNIDGDITSKIKVTNDLDLRKAGIYYYRYNVSDNSGNAAKEAIRVMIVEEDVVVPEFSLQGSKKMIWEVGKSWSDPGYKAVDTCSGIDTVEIIGMVDVNKLGFYKLEYTAKDKSGNSVLLEREVEVKDTTSPVASLKGYSSYYIEVHGSFTDSGLIVTDNWCTNNEIKVNGSVDVHKLGVYTLTYEVRDCAGNGPVILTRVVTIYDSTSPQVSMSPYTSGDTIRMPVYGDVRDYLPDVNYSDNYYIKGDLTRKELGNFFVEFPGGKPNKLGIYRVINEISDPSGNMSSVYLDIEVEDKESPVIKLKGSQIVELCRFKELSTTELECTVTDNYYTNLTATQSGTYFTEYLPTKKEGLYTVKYNVSDGSGNAAKEVVRYVDVIFDSAKCNVGIEEPERGMRVEVYPNPTRGQLNVYTELAGEGEIRIELLNSVGEVLREITGKGRSGELQTIDMSVLTSGMYLVRIISEEGQIVKRVILNK